MKKHVSVFITFLLIHLATWAQQANFFLTAIDLVFARLSYDSIPYGYIN